MACFASDQIEDITSALNEMGINVVESEEETENLTAKVEAEAEGESTETALIKVEAAKTPADFFKLYAENSKKAFDSAVAQTSKTSELVVKLANDSFAPISNRVSVFTSKVKAA